VTVNAQVACPVSWLTIEPQHPALAGHFPDNPIVPGVVLLDHVLALVQARFAPQGIACRIPWAKFLRPVLPDQQVLLGLEAVSQGEVRFTCRIGALRVAEGTVVLDRTAEHE
jgi:3-hydroxymyristoyl/3-hydroxydecanoyl-(acyl carrier protein) dehydratase